MFQTAVRQRCTRAPPPAARRRTSALVAMLVSPGVVIARAPWAAPYSTAAARELLAEVADAPIISPHGHVPPEWLAQNVSFADPTGLLLTPDHYTNRLLHSLGGVELEQLGVPVGSELSPERSRAAFRLLCEHWHLLAGTPVQTWFTEVFHDVFGLGRPPRPGRRPGLERPGDPDVPPRRLSGAGPARLAGVDRGAGTGGRPGGFHLCRARRGDAAPTGSVTFYKTSGFIDDTRAFCSIPARHGIARRCDAGFLARLVVEHRLGMDEAVAVARDLVDAIPRRAFKLD